MSALRIDGILETLNRHDVEYVVIGGIAALAHGVRRLTLDVDIVPAPDHSNHERLAAALAELGASMAVDSELRDLDPTDPFDVARAGNLRLDTTMGGLDLVNRPQGLDSFASLAAAAVEVSVRGVPARVADRDRLIAMKLSTGRPKDLQDVADLTAGETDRA